MALTPTAAISGSLALLYEGNMATVNSYTATVSGAWNDIVNDLNSYESYTNSSIVASVSASLASDFAPSGAVLPSYTAKQFYDEIQATVSSTPGLSGHSYLQFAGAYVQNLHAMIKADMVETIDNYTDVMPELVQIKQLADVNTTYFNNEGIVNITNIMSEVQNIIDNMPLSFNISSFQSAMQLLNLNPATFMPDISQIAYSVKPAIAPVIIDFITDIINPVITEIDAFVADVLGEFSAAMFEEKMVTWAIGELDVVFDTSGLAFGSLGALSGSIDNLLGTVTIPNFTLKSSIVQNVLMNTIGKAQVVRPSDMLSTGLGLIG